MWRLLWRIVVGDGAPGRAFEVVGLAALERPEKCRQAGETEGQCKRNEDDEDLHQAPSPLKAGLAAEPASASPCLTSAPALRARSAFSITRMDEPDMAAAAISGVTMPLIAIGTASTL